MGARCSPPILRNILKIFRCCPDDHADARLYFGHSFGIFTAIAAAAFCFSATPCRQIESLHIFAYRLLDGRIFIYDALSNERLPFSALALRLLRRRRRAIIARAYFACYKP